MRVSCSEKPYYSVCSFTIVTYHFYYYSVVGDFCPHRVTYTILFNFLMGLYNTIFDCNILFEQQMQLKL